MKGMKVHIIPVLSDNYVYIVKHSPGKVFAVDPGEAGPVLDFLKNHNLKLDTIILTHHHGDHIAGCGQLIEEEGCTVYGPEKDQTRISFIDKGIRDGEEIKIGDFKAQAIETPGHTSNHLCFYDRDNAVLFAGDTLFAMGCGRIFEGTMEQMYESIQKLKALPEETKIYCGHEYTLTNGRFAQTVDGDNEMVNTRLIQEEQKRNAGKPTLPSTIALEKQTNPFFRAESLEQFERLRLIRDNF